MKSVNWFERELPARWCPLGDGIHAALVTFTPESAAMILRDRPAPNRNIRDRQVNYLQKALVDDQFLLTGETIVFNYKGLLINGRHRLTACVKSDKPLRTVVIAGVSPEAFKVIDLNSRRSLAQVLGMVGHKNSTVLGGAITLCTGFFTRGEIGNKFELPASMDDRLNFLEKHPRLSDSVTFLGTNSSGSVFGFRALPAAFHYLTSLVDTKDADEFMEAFKEHSVPAVGRWSGPHLFYKRLVSGRVLSGKRLVNREVLTKAAVISGLVRAWNHFRDGTECQAFHIGRGDSRQPRLSGWEYREGLPIRPSRNLDVEHEKDSWKEAAC